MSSPVAGVIIRYRISPTSGLTKACPAGRG